MGTPLCQTYQEGLKILKMIMCLRNVYEENIEEREKMLQIIVHTDAGIETNKNNATYKDVVLIQPCNKFDKRT